MVSYHRRLGSDLLHMAPQVGFRSHLLPSYRIAASTGPDSQCTYWRGRPITASSSRWCRNNLSSGTRGYSIHLG